MVDVHDRLASVAGVVGLEDVYDSPHGFSGFTFRDPEGNVWDVAWKQGSEVGDDGSLTWN